MTQRPDPSLEQRLELAEGPGGFFDAGHADDVDLAHAPGAGNVVSILDAATPARVSSPPVTFLAGDEAAHLMADLLDDMGNSLRSGS